MTIPFPAHAWPLMKQALQHIADHPSEFDMADWVARDQHCGTTACLAGRIALIANPAEPVPNDFAACAAMGIDTWSGIGAALDEVFYDTGIATYAELSEALLARFTFPEPLPTPSKVVA